MSDLAEIKGEAHEALKSAVEQRHPISNLEQLGVGQRLINLFQSNDINDMRDLMFKSRQELLSLANFGQRQLEILFVALSKYHYVED